MTTLYEDLGVPADADKKTIRGAYKKKAKKAHPDAGGTPEKFGALKKAHDILTNDARRAKYDATGDISEIEPDNAASQVLAIISVVMNQVLDECAKNKKSPVERDILALMKSRIRSCIEDVNNNMGMMRPIIATDEKLASRFKKKKSADNIFEQIMRARLEPMRQRYKDLGRQKEVALEAIKILDEYGFQWDQPAARSQMEENLSIKINFNTWG